MSNTSGTREVPPAPPEGPRFRNGPPSSPSRLRLDSYTTKTSQGITSGPRLVPFRLVPWFRIDRPLLSCKLRQGSCTSNIQTVKGLLLNRPIGAFFS